MVLLLGAVEVGRFAGRFLEENRGEVDAPVFPVVDAVAELDALGLTNHLFDGAESQFGHDFAQSAHQIFEEGDHVLRLTLELRPQFAALGGDTDGAGVSVALAHHDAALHDEGGGGGAPLLRAQEGRNRQIARGLHLTVGLHHDAVAKLVAHQRLVGFGQAQFPGQAGMLDGTERGGAGAAVEAGDQDGVGLRFADARGDGANAGLGDELDVDARLAVGILEVEDQLGEILDGIDVMVRGRGDETDTRCRVAGTGDPAADLVTGQVSAFAGLGSLGHLDLQFLSIAQIVAVDPEAARGDLLGG